MKINSWEGQRGNVLFLILIAVALFAALSYAVTQSNRSGASNTDKEQAKLDQAVIENYLSAVNFGKMKLETLYGCTVINYDPPSAWGIEDKSCHMFHPDGAGVTYVDLGLDSCNVEGKELSDLYLGEVCGNIVYAGVSGGNRIYTTTSDQPSTTWNNGTANWTTTGTTSTSDGLANTDTLIGLSDAGAPYAAAATCRALGADWYLPSKDELNLLYINKDEGALNGTFDESGTYYWSSSEQYSNTAWRQRFSTVHQPDGSKDSTRAIRCVRSD